MGVDDGCCFPDREWGRRRSGRRVGRLPIDQKLRCDPAGLSIIRSHVLPGHAASLAAGADRSPSSVYQAAVCVTPFPSHLVLRASSSRCQNSHTLHAQPEWWRMVGEEVAAGVAVGVSVGEAVGGGDAEGDGEA